MFIDFETSFSMFRYPVFLLLTPSFLLVHYYFIPRLLRSLISVEYCTHDTLRYVNDGARS